VIDHQTSQTLEYTRRDLVHHHFQHIQQSEAILPNGTIDDSQTPKYIIPYWH
jgi:hypothetical protein